MEPDDVAANMKDQATPIEEIQGEDQEKVDRISSLPDELIHHIMSLLPIEDATRTSALSKRWEFLFSTFPIVEFDEIWFYQMDDDNEKGRRMFIQYLRESLSRRHFNLMQKLRISTVFPHDYELNHLVNRYVASALLRGRVQQIHLRIKNPPDPLVCDHYVLPRVIFSSGSSLVTLILEDCQCGVYSKVSFPSLKNLTMRYVHVTNRLVQRMISNSPQIDTLRLEFCHGFDTLKVFNRRLRRLIVCGCNDLFVFEMDTPSLNYFKCNGTRCFFRRINFYDNGPQMRAVECTEISQFKVSNAKSFCSLETLVLAFVRMNAEVFRSILSTFPNVENMELLNSIFVKIPSVLLEKLKMVEMKNCHFSELVGFNAPNLETLKCKGGGRRFCVLSYFGGKGFCSLKTVSLAGYGGLTDQSLRELLSYCFFLEDLNLKSCDSLEHANVISATLKTLVLHSCFNLLDGEIHAPKLVFFQYVGKVVQISPIISSSNFEAEIHLENTITDVVNDELIKLKKLLRNFGQARVLTISSNYSMYVVFPEEVAKPFPPLAFVPHLKVRAAFQQTSFLKILLGVLRTSICRETLSINIDSSSLQLKFEEVKGAREMDFSHSELEVHDCILQHLTEVRFEGFYGSIDQLELLNYLLRRAKLLKIMFILYSQAPANAHAVLPDHISRIINYPKNSPAAQITFI